MERFFAGVRPQVRVERLDRRRLVILADRVPGRLGKLLAALQRRQLDGRRGQQLLKPGESDARVREALPRIVAAALVDEPPEVLRHAAQVNEERRGLPAREHVASTSICLAMPKSEMSGTPDEMSTS